jgi:DNA-directed RNA polymerase specialized sigma24 family protein
MEIFTKEFSDWLHKRTEATARARNWFGVVPADLAQDVMLAIFKATEKGQYEHQGDAQLRAFAIKTMRNLAINTMGSFKRKEGNLVSLDAISGDDDRPFDVIDTRGDTDPRLEDLRAAVGKLKGRRKEVMELTLDGYKVRDIVATGRFKTAATVSQLKHNAMAELRKLLKEE